MLGPIVKNGFVGLILACALCAAPPALASYTPQPATGSDPAPQEAPPEDAPPPPRTFGIRSLPPEQVATTAPKKAEIVRTEGQSRPSPPPEPRLRAVPSEPAAVTFRRAIAPTPAPVAETTTSSAAAASSAPQRASRRDAARSEPVAPAEPLSARVVPRPVREIAEVVPNEIWALLAALGLLACALAVSSWVAAMRTRRLRRQREDLLQEVGLLQAALLPSVPPDAPVSVAYRPANGASAGGDFYDAFGLPGDRTGLILGDVCGHGRDALARTTFVRYTLRAYLEAGLEPREVLKVGSNALAEHLDGGFATVIVAVYEHESSRFTYASAGHPPPVLTGGSEAWDPVTACSAPPLGIGEHTGFRQSAFTLTSGARVCLYTDGVTEARADRGLLGVARLERALDELPADAGADRLLDAIVEMSDQVPDDMAACLVTAPAGPASAGPRIEELEVDEHEVGDALERFLRACGVALVDVPGILREAGEAARREGSATVRVRSGQFRPGVDVVPRNLVRLAERRRIVR